ncbi:GTP pyrophosphokinase [Ammoniphilus oxalaticus]|uniref:GTP diphosphokinase n=1 Tax=Ammoniphilus oxalaticus TaxID=66863 RepID=A0A419SK16_9BACL|nr:GTP pyrophosphokinase family protein [Ammoniphilus oxalaticus]RKD24315.1 GTP pyrophosphokinase [Ammoniphilus oxalaticus]
MSSRDWDKFLIPYEQAVEELKIKFRGIRKEYKKREDYSPIEFVTGRVKKLSSIFNKAKRLNVSMEEIDTGIEDIAGIRIMCQFVEDIAKVKELIRQRDKKDMDIVYEKDYVNNQKESGYRSYHFIIRYPVQTSIGQREILAEIQIRTLAMNFWATIEHSLNYKYEQNIPPHIRERLVRAAEAAYELDQEMSLIRDEVTEAQQEFETKSQMVSNILRDIQRLYTYGHVTEADRYYQSFKELWEFGKIAQLHLLAQRIRVSIENALNE